MRAPTTHLRHLFRTLFLVAALVALCLSNPPAETTAAPGTPASVSSHVEGLLDNGVTVTAGATSSTNSQAQAMIDAGLMRFDREGRLETQIQTADVAATLASIDSVGGKFQAADNERGVVQALLSVSAIRSLLLEPHVEHVSEPAYGVVNRGSVGIESFGLLQMDLLRSAFGAEGRGVRVGVISDGVGGIGKAQASGDLPDVDVTTCNAVAGSDPQASGAEGTALLEVVHDLAPRAELYFGNYAFSTYHFFNDAVACLAQHVDVIIDDISWFVIGPFDGSGPVSEKVTEVMTSEDNRLMAYVTAVGNYARRHWAGDFTPCNETNRQIFFQGDGTIDRDNVGPRCNNPMAVGPGATLLGFLQWDDPFTASCNDYNMFVFGHDNSDLLSSSTGDQDCSANPTEVISWRNDSGSMVTVDLVVERLNPSVEQRRFDLFIAGGVPNFYTPAGSIGSAADSPEAIAVGAVPINDPGLDDIQPYSSLGPSATGIVKPEIAAPDCVSVTGSGGFGTPFCGTSAAAPHIAAVLAVLIGCNPVLMDDEAKIDRAAEREALRDALLENAADRQPLGPDNTWGHGLVDPLTAALQYCTPPEVVVGNVNCDTRVDSVDSLYLLRHTASLPPDALCLGSGDVNCSDTTDAIDSLGVLRFAAGLPALPAPPGCPPIGVVPGVR